MEQVMQWGLEVITTIQKVGNPFLDTVFKGITSLGNEEFFLIVIPLVFWCVDTKKGIRLAMVVLLANFVNQFFKEWWQQPRPFDLRPDVGLIEVEGFGLPSGHAQGAVVFWGVLGSWFAKPWNLLVAIILPLLIGFSRVYLGVHFPTDVFAGWGIGLFILGSYLLAGKLFIEWFLKLSITRQVIILAATTAVLQLLNLKDTMSPALFLGMSGGYLLMKLFVKFDASAGSILLKLLRFIMGITVSAVIYIGLKSLFPGEGSPGYHVFRFLRYFLLAVWVALGAPWMFKISGLLTPQLREGTR